MVGKTLARGLITGSEGFYGRCAQVLVLAGQHGPHQVEAGLHVAALSLVEAV